MGEWRGPRATGEESWHMVLTKNLTVSHKAHLCAVCSIKNHKWPSAEVIRKEATNSNRLFHKATRLPKQNNTSKTLLRFTEKSSIFHPNWHTVSCTKWQSFERTLNIPFTVFTKTCFSLVGSFSSTSTPWKMRPNVPVKEKTQGFIWSKASHANVTSLTGSHVSADLRTEINKVLLCLLMGLDSPGSCQREKSQTEFRDSSEGALWQKTIQICAQRGTSPLYELSAHCWKAFLWGEMPFKKINHQHKLKTICALRLTCVPCVSTKEEMKCYNRVSVQLSPSQPDLEKTASLSGPACSRKQTSTQESLQSLSTSDAWPGVCCIYHSCVYYPFFISLSL